MAEIQKNWIINWINEFSSIKIFIKEIYPNEGKKVLSLWARWRGERSQGDKADMNLGQLHYN